MKTQVDIGGLKYTIHEDGKIEKRRGKGFLKCFPDKDGYLKVSISRSGNKTYNEALHRVLWRAFKGSIPEGMTVDHIDNDKLHNHVDNYQLLSSENNAIKGNAKKWIVIDPEGQEFMIYNLQKFCKEMNFHKSHLRSTANPNSPNKSYKGWKAKYVNEFHDWDGP